MSYPSFYSYSVPLGAAHHITIKILGMDGNLKDVKLLADTGNDVTLLTRETSQGKLGINPDTIPDDTGFEVFGITDKPVLAKEINNMIQIGDLRPVWIPVGIITEYGAFAEDLLGRKGLLDNGLYEVIYDEDSVDFREKHMNMNIGPEGYNKPSSSFRESFKSIRNNRSYSLS